MAAMLVSVAVNFDDDRAFGPEALASWRTDQGYDGQLEVLAVSNGASPVLDDQVRAMLHPEDRFVLVPGASRIEMYDAGVRAASGEIVVITEAHCAAEPGCLGRLVSALSDDSAHAAFGETIPVADTTFARLDAEIFQRGAAIYGADGDWRKVVPHAFAIRRDSYIELGGFETRYDLFAEQLLAATMHREGKPIVAVPGARARHRFAEHPREVLRVVEGFARGQALHRADRVPDALDGQLFPLGFLEPTDVDRRVAVGSVIGARAVGSPFRDWARWLSHAALPMGARVAVDSVGLSVARLRCRIWYRGGPRLERAYLDLSAIATRRARRKGMTEAGPPRRAGLDQRGTWTCDSDSTSCASFVGRWSGCHGPEEWNGQSFVWIEPTATLVTDLPRGDWTLVLHTGGFGRDPRQARVRIALDGRPVPRGAVSIDERSVAIAVPSDRLRSGRAQCWVVATDPLELSADGTDPRRLGLPITAIEIC